MSNKRNRFRILLAALIAATTLATAYAVDSYLGSFETTYPAAAGTSLDRCTLCHTSSSGGSRNSYGSDYATNGHSFKAIENLDSDGDGFTNLQEIKALTLPGSASSKPASDTTAPTVTAFSIPSTASSLTVSFTSFTATDDVGVTAYLVNESSTKPSASASGWTASKPTSYTFASEGPKTLYAWAKDAANNVSSSLSASTTITLPPTGDTIAPTITAFTIPATSTSLTVSITSLVASDNVGVTGYLLSESSSKPATGVGGWSASSPSSYTFGSAGAKTLYAWAKDGAGNVSNSMSASTKITLPSTGDTSAPTITTFTLPATSTSLTVPITSFLASDNVAITGYLVSESSTKPTADAAGWKSSPPASYTFATSGAKVLYGWAKDAAGNVSDSKSAATAVTSTGGSALDMSVWSGTWFKVRINRDAGKEDWKEGDDDSGENGAESDSSGEIAYVKIRSWDADTKVLQASIYYQNGKKGPWASADLPFHYTTGDPGRFLFWFEYAGEFQFAAGMIAKIDDNQVVKARFNAAGIYLYKTEEEMAVDVNLALTISSGMVAESKVPLEALALASGQTK